MVLETETRYAIRDGLLGGLFAGLGFMAVLVGFVAAEQFLMWGVRC